MSDRAMVSRHTTDRPVLEPADAPARAADGSGAEGSRHIRPDRTLALQIAIALAGFLLLATVWLAVLVSVDTEERDAQLRAEGTATNLAFAAEGQLNRQLLATDQVLQSLAAEWAADPVRFEANGWRRRVAVPDDLTLQIYLLDARGSVVSATRSELMGLDMSQLEHYTVQRGGRGKALFVGPAIRWKTNGRWEINLSRRLQREDGSFAGAIVATYDPWALTSLLEKVDPGGRELIALVGDDGALRSLVSPGEVQPGQDIGGAAMFRAAMLRAQGTWTGPSSPDGVVRVHAFRRLRDQGLTVVIGIGKDEAMHAAGLWKANARLAGGAVSATLLLLAYLLLREVRAARRRERRLAQDRRTVERAYEDLAAAKAIAEAKTAQLETTLAGMSDGVMVLDSELRLCQWNDRFADCTGVPRNLVVSGQPMAALLRGQAMAGEFGALADPVEMEHEVRRRLKVLRDERGTVLIERTRPDGSTLELRRTRLPGGGMVTLYTDVTARKRAADAQAAARALADEAIAQKSRFVAIVSHEIRTPLNAVINSLGLLDVTGLSTSQRKLAGTARDAGEALMDLVNDILELSKAEAGDLAVRAVDYELRPLLDGVHDMFRAEAMRSGMHIQVDVHAAVPRHLRGDAGRLRQVMINLVSNAIKFSQPGTIRIAAETVLTEAGWMLALAVQDNGQPIGEMEAAQLFQPFSRLDNARHAGTPGTGLGLAICDRLAQLMGGRIGLRRAPEGGNEFWLAVPLVAGVPLSALPADSMPVTRQRRMMILLVEDIPANHLVTATLLRREGHRVDVAESGAAAVRMARMQPYDLIFMDLIMPGMSGFEAARQIRALPGLEGRVRIVALTATTAAEDRARCLAAGMMDMLGKPVRPQEMLAVLARLASTEDTPPPPEKPPLAQMLDMERLADLRQGLAPATLLSLVDQCLEDMRRRLPLLRDAINAGSGADIEMAAHALAGMAASYGLADMERRMRRIIAAGRASDRPEAVAAAVRMEDALAEAAQALHNQLRTVPA